MFGKANNPVRLGRLLMQHAPFIVRQLHNENYAVKKGGNSSSDHLAHRDINNLQDWSQSAHGWTEDGNYNPWCLWFGRLICIRVILIAFKMGVTSRIEKHTWI